MPTVQRTSKKLWLPSDRDRDQIDQKRHADKPAPTAEEPDELEALLDTYEQAAQADKQKVEDAQKEEKRKPTSMKDLRAEGLANPLTASNRGFQLLSKMGYQPGQGLGKTASGAAVPIAVEVKSTRTGLGIDESRKERQTRQAEMQLLRATKRQRQHAAKQTDFRGDQAAAAMNRTWEGQLKQAARTSEDLDRRAGLTESPLWPLEPKAETGDDPEDESEVVLDPVTAAFQELPLADRLQQTLHHLRQTYHYCLFCGHQYGSQGELASSCPGPSEDAH
ncbi:hypothetical protein WJX84_008409 [Apatococcus fuscideae]|uniref:G-patch domain-containing protein n=1 Tax=Apatococcus fuscideae TaxID=2026836 RepID=A0AAW1SD20_9CHLO